jgi:replicative DNA helicase
MTSRDEAPRRVPQHDLDAEAAVLSAIMLDRVALDTTIPILRPEQFYSNANRRIYEAAVALAESGSPVDLVTVVGRLRETGRIAEIGGSQYVSSLIDNVPAVAHIETYAKKVRDRYQLRRFGNECAKYASASYDHKGGAKELIDEGAQVIFELTLDSVDRGFVAVGPEVRAEYTRLAEAAARGERLTGVPTGFERIDAKLGGLHDGDLTIVAARPGIGKTAWVLNVAANVAARETEPRQGIAFFSLEMPKEQLSMRLMCTEARVDLGKARQGFLQERDWIELTEAAKRIFFWPIFIDDTPAISIVELRSKLRQLIAEKEREGIKISVVIVDYLQLMTGDTSGNREQEISSLSRGLKRVAKELRVPVVALSQLNRSTETRGKDKRPQLSDLRESGAIEQDADNVLFLYREDYYDTDCEERGVAEINVAKQRNGPTGSTKCRYESAYTRFDNLAPGEGFDE